MALVLNKSLFFHIPATGGSFVREAIRQIGQPVGLELKGKYAPPALVERQNRYSFTFVRHPLNWYESYFKFKTHCPDYSWDPKIVFDRLCHAKTFENFIKNVIQNCPRYVSCMYKLYTEIDTNRELNFIGRREHLKADLIKALTEAGEEFDPKVIEGLPIQHVSPMSVEWDPKLRSQIIDLEEFAMKRFSYVI